MTSPPDPAHEVVQITAEDARMLFRDGWEVTRRRLGLAGGWLVTAVLHARQEVVAASPEAPFLVDASGPEPGPDGALDHADLLYVHPGLCWFAGHFPGRPLVPGVVQIDWAAERAAQLGFPAERFRTLSSVKFAAPVAPGAVVLLKLRAWAPDRVAFAIESADAVHCRGLLHYGE